MSETMDETATAMTWEEYEALPEDVCLEYVDGMAIVNPTPNLLHQYASSRFTAQLKAGRREPCLVVEHWGWKPGADEFGPDIIVVPPTEERTRFTGIPILLVEILSSNRTHDLVRKFQKYATFGAPRYWILDPEKPPTLTAYELADGAYAEVARVVGRDRARLSFGTGEVEVCPADLLAEPD